MKAAFYCCYPTDCPGAPDILEQQLLLMELLKQLKGVLYAIYVDRGNSAGEAYAQMLADGQKHCFDVLLCLSPKLLRETSKTELSNLVTIFPDHE